MVEHGRTEYTFNFVSFVFLLRLCIPIVMYVGARGGVVFKALRYKPAGRGFNSRCCNWNFSVTQSCRSHYGPGVDSASNRNEYQVYFLGGKGGRCVGLTTLPPSCPVVMKSGNLNFLEPWGPLQACKRDCFTFHLSCYVCSVLYILFSSCQLALFGYPD
jgi:hypothetical protein